MQMTAVTPSDLKPHIALPKRASVVLVLLLLFLGLMSFAMVKALDADCANEYLVADDGLTRLTTDDGKFLVTGRVWLRIGDVRLPLPERVHSILSKSGLMPAECK
jgi:hypothetical protein